MEVIEEGVLRAVAASVLRAARLAHTTVKLADTYAEEDFIPSTFGFDLGRDLTDRVVLGEVSRRGWRGGGA